MGQGGLTPARATGDTRGMDMLTAVGVVVGLLFLIGLVGAVIPWLPGPLFIVAGAVLWAFATDFAEIGIGRLTILAAIALVTFLLNFVAGAVGARRYGGSRWGVVGALGGAVVGFFFGPLGLLVGPVADFVAALAMVGLFLWWVWRG